MGLLKSVDGPRIDVNDITTFEYYGSDDSTCATTPALCTYRKGDLRKTIDALGRATEVLGYDPQGRPLSVLDANGVVTDYEYTARGWLTEGNELKYCYDRFGQVVRMVQIVAGKSFTLNYAYTIGGHLCTVTYPDGTTVDYARDARARIKEIGVRPYGGTRPVLLNNAAYEPFGPVAGWAYGNGRTLNRTYDLDYRPKTIFDTASGGLSLGYGYNTVGELTELKDGLQSASLAGYEYDTLGRLTKTLDGVNPMETYSYDKTGNRKSLLRGGITDAYVYPTTSHRLSSVAGVARAYNTVGNTTSVGGTAKQYVYNANDRLSQFKQAGVIKASYRYNAIGERVATTGATTTVIDTYTLYDESGNWIGDYDSAGAAKQQAVWFGNAPVGLVVGSGGTQTLHYVQPDHLGTPRAVIDPSRNVAIWSWDAKSEVFGNSPPNQDPDQDGTAFVFNMRFSGQRFDAASGLIYNYFRDYDPGTGRYLQSDPVGLNGGTSTYGYVRSNPLLAIDPYGLQDTLEPLSNLGRRTDIPRLSLESQVSAKPLSPAGKAHLDRGCIGLVSLYQRLNVKIPEQAPGTTCYVSQPRAEAAATCKNPTIFAKQGHWRRGRPTPSASGQIPNDSVAGGKVNPGYFNYVIYFQQTDTYAWMNHEVQANQSANPQMASISPEPPITYDDYPQEMWCVTCPAPPKTPTPQGSAK
ncbi:hypothetical protein D9T17_02475 [Lysobacter enzymogenes]|uniref:Teneurin-like YD-shell domain-containing protein n=1 Tax=Lysobacter enzymogenes TaxID=69 RepID=A0A3N2RNM4_LYSEN|nr:hypothetical protein D9T17_02475 [Lysobacter enzymogenes]